VSAPYHTIQLEGTAIKRFKKMGALNKGISIDQNDCWHEFTTIPRSPRYDLGVGVMIA
jgi:hypothetical protein